jgi:spore coat polysaccharide biosynthesis protein SpsF
MKTVVIVQARMASTRLPGKMMFPLDCKPIIEHIIRRVTEVPSVDEVVVATSSEKQDDVIEQTLSKVGLSSTVFRGSESDVLGRMYNAATACEADIIVRMCGDRPLIPLTLIDEAVEYIKKEGIDYVGNMDVDGFATGFGVEAFSKKSFQHVEQEATSETEREHVTPYYRENEDSFQTAKLRPDEVFRSQVLLDSGELRLTLDEAADYELIEKVYNNVEYDNVIPAERAVKYIFDQNLSPINKSVDQKTI